MANKFSHIIVRYDKMIMIIFVVFNIVIYSFLSFQKHNHFQTFAWDSSFFIQELYFIKQFKPPFTSLYQMNALGDHFQIMFLSLGGVFYFIWSDSRVIFLIQAVSVSLSLLFLYLTGQKILSNSALKKVWINLISFAITFSFIFSLPMQALMTDEIHNDSLAILPIFAMFYFLLTKRFLLFWLSFVSLLLTKETYGLFAAPLAFYIYLLSKNLRISLIALVTGLVTFISLVYFVMPRLSPTAEYFHYTEGNRPGDVIGEIIKDPRVAFYELFDHQDKIKTIVLSLQSFGFIPLIDPIHLTLPLSALAIRFYDDSTPLLYRFNNHYASPLMPFLAIATIFSLLKLINHFRNNKKIIHYLPVLVLIVLFSSTIIQDIIFSGAVNSLFKKSFYETKQWEKDAYELIQRVPREVTVASQNSLLPHLSQRDNFYLLPKIGDAKYIAVDLEEGPNKFAPLQNSKEMETLIDNLIKNNEFKIIFQKNKAILLQKRS